MKIFNCMLASGMGGMEQMSVTYIKAMIANGDEVHALYMKNSPYLEELLELGVHMHLMSGRSVYNPLNAIKVAQLFRQIKPDIIFLHGNRSMRLARYPIIQSVLPVDAPMVGKAHNFDCKYLPIMDCAIATTKYWKKELEKITGKPVFYLPNTVPVLPKRTPSLHKPLVIGTMSRLHTNKAFDTLLDATKVLKDAGYQFKVIIGGDGPERQALMDQRKRLGLENIVEFPGWISNKEEFYDQIDFFCLSSRTEPFGTVVLEAMVRSTPVASTTCAGPVEMINNGQSGLLFPIDDVPAMAAALQQFLDDPKKALKMGAEGRKTVEREYGFDTFRKELKQLQNDIVKGA